MTATTARDAADALRAAIAEELEVPPDSFDVATELASELKIMAEWLGLEDVEVLPRGDLAPALTAVRG